MAVPVFADGWFWGVLLECRANPYKRTVIKRCNGRQQYVYPRNEITVMTVHFVAIHVRDFVEAKSIVSDLFIHPRWKPSLETAAP